MLLKKECFYNLECDCCHTLVDSDMWHVDSQDLDEIASQNSWCNLGGKYYCPKCWHYGDDDNIYTNDGNVWDGDTEELIQ